MEKIKIGIADDHPIVLAGVSNIINACGDMEIVFAASEISDLLHCLQNNVIDVLICDYEFEDDVQADGLHLLRRIQRLVPDLPILFLSAHTAVHIVSGAIRQGAGGFIGKGQADFVQLGNAVRVVHAGRTYLPEALVDSLREASLMENKPQGLQALSEKEMVVAQMICAGQSITDIAQRLRRSPKTISNQKNAAMKKIGASNDVEMVNIMRDLTAQ